MTSYDLGSRIALVTGAAQGLGEGMARALAAAGAKVTVADLQDSGADIATALGLKHGLRAMRPGGSTGNGGSIVNVSSVAATIAFPGIAVYSATKSAVDRLTRVAAMEAGAGLPVDGGMGM